MKKLKQYDHLELNEEKKTILREAIKPEVLDLEVTFDMGLYNHSYTSETQDGRTCCMLGRLDFYCKEKPLSVSEDLKELLNLELRQQPGKSHYPLTSYLGFGTSLLYDADWGLSEYNESKYMEHFYRYSLEHGVICFNPDDYCKSHEKLHTLMSDLLELNPLTGEQL